MLRHSPRTRISPRRDFLRKNSRKAVCWSFRRSILADWSLPILRFANGRFNMDLSHEEYPQAEPESLICIIFTSCIKEMHKMHGNQSAVLEIRDTDRQD